MASIEAVPVPTAVVAAEEVDGDLVVFDQQSSRLHVLNSSATAIYLRCDGKTSVGAIVAAIAAGYDVPVDVVEGDVATTVDRLCEEGLVRLDSNPRER